MSRVVLLTGSRHGLVVSSLAAAIGERASLRYLTRHPPGRRVIIVGIWSVGRSMSVVSKVSPISCIWLVLRLMGIGGQRDTGRRSRRVGCLGPSCYGEFSQHEVNVFRPIYQLRQ